jgi:conjugal transfer pilus assembly protein TraE
MNIAKFLETWRGTQFENKFLRIITVLLSASLLILVVSFVNREIPVILVPPEITEQVRISKNSADAETKKAWALYVAQLIGNVTPGNADFVAEVIEPLLHPRIYKSVRENLAYQIESLKLERVSLNFTPRAVAYEPDTDRVYVNGTLISQGLGDARDQSVRTYELEIDIDNFRPMITFLDVYKGGMRTQAKKVQIQSAEDRKKASEERNK